MNKGKTIGIILIICSMLSVTFNPRITGAAINTNLIFGMDILSIFFMILGILLLTQFSLEKNLAQQTLQSGAIITDPKKIIKIAKKMGYNSSKKVKEGFQILDDSGKPLTVVPRHHISSGVYRSIMKSLSSGESNFRRYKFD
jgi:hypothetical protein